MNGTTGLLFIGLLAGAALAGCLVPKDDSSSISLPHLPQRLERREVVEGVPFHASLAAGGLSRLTLEDSSPLPVVLQFPMGVLLGQDGRLVLSDVPTVQLEPGQAVEFIVPPNRRALYVTLVPAIAASLPSGSAAGTLSLEVPNVWGEKLLDASHWYELMRTVELHYPDRYAGHANYLAYQRWAGDYLLKLGYRVEIDPYGTDRLNDVGFPHPFGGGRGAGSAPANVCAYQAGTALPNEWIVFGGHYDVAETTTHGAYDNTAGALVVLELARFFARASTDRTLVFCNWGGEEDGLWGSNAFASTLPAGVTIALYVNFDMTGLNWPGPLPKPLPLRSVSLGAHKDRIQPVLERAQVGFLGFPPEAFRFEANATGPASDSLSFSGRGWPAIYHFSLGSQYPWYHKPGDTLDNMTALMYGGVSASVTSDDLTSEEIAEGKELLLRGYELVLWSAAYDAFLVDRGELALDAPGLLRVT